MARSFKKLARLGLAAGIAGLGCADWDNPTALSELEPDAEFEIEATRVETFEELEVHVHVSEGGTPLDLTESELEIESHATGATQVVGMLPEGDGYAAHVMFFEPGEHHLHLTGMPHGHRLMVDLGEHEIEVHRRHQVIGPYWVELGVSPAPVLPGSSGHIHLYAFELDQDGLPGAPASGLVIEADVHAPDGGESHLQAVEEEAGEYEIEYAFETAGVYEFHVGIEVGAEHVDGAFQLPVIDRDEGGDTDGGHDDEGGDGHDHEH